MCDVVRSSVLIEERLALQTAMHRLSKLPVKKTERITLCPTVSLDTENWISKDGFEYS